MVRGELDFGNHPFTVTWSGYNPLGKEKRYEAQDKTIFPPKRILNPEAEIKAGMFYARRFIWTPEDRSLDLGNNISLKRNDVYYYITFGPGKYGPKDVKDGHKALAKIALKDSKVAMIIGVTWLHEFAKRWGWTTSISVDTNQGREIQNMIPEGKLRAKSLNQNSKADQARVDVKKRNYTPMLVYMTKADLMKRYG